MCRILIDADGCPVVHIAASVAAAHNLECILFCDTAHQFHISGTKNIVCSTGSNSVDFSLVNHVLPGDIVITQDYGLAAMCLSRSALVLHQDGMEYTSNNIDSLLLTRHTAKKIRSGGGRIKGNPKRTKKQDVDFKNALENIIVRKNI